MRREQLEHAIRTACQILGVNEVIVVGSQAILGSIPERDLPSVATLSREVDILPIAKTAAEVDAMADKLAGVAGEWSPFDDLHGFHVDGVSLDTCIFPEGWRDRLVRVSNANTAAPGGDPVFTGWCVDKEDLCVAKLYAYREKDVEFVRALIDANLVSADIILDRISQTSGDSTLLDRAGNLVRSVGRSMSTLRYLPSLTDSPAAPRTEARCGQLLSNGRSCIRPLGHPPTGHRATP